MTTDPTLGQHADARPAAPRMVRTSVIVGTTLEYYDFYLYGIAAALVFNTQFFVSEDPLIATIGAFATYAVGFVARPLGAVVFGQLGDTIGRRRALVLTLIVIGLSTGVVGLLPTYASIGVWAPIALVVLRFVQGVSFGGEWAGAVTLAVEHAPQGREGHYSSLPQIGSPIGNVLGSMAFLAVGLLPMESFDAWGWRIPFLAAFPLMLVTLWLRSQVEESPTFKKLEAQGSTQKVPALRVFRESLDGILAGAALSFVTIGGFFLVTTFSISYGTGTVGLSANTMLIATLLASLGQVTTVIVSGLLVDKGIPAFRIALTGLVLMMVVAVPAIYLLSSGSALLAILAIFVLVQPIAMTHGMLGMLLPGLFDAELRYSGVAISYNLSGMVGGFMPMLATYLLLRFDSEAWPIAALLMVIATISLVGGVWVRVLLRRRESRRRRLP